MSTVSIPLSKLQISQHNVRHPGEGDPANAVHDLQASILAQGLMNPLQVHPIKARGRPKSDGQHYAVHAGGRRLRALQGLVTDGHLPADHEVDCYVSAAPAADLSEASLAENLVRVALKPTAEFEAFAALAAQGMAEDVIASRYAVTVLHVRQRMRLGRLHPDILAALDGGTISLDLAKAYAATEDQALQKRVFGEMSPWNHQAYNVRNAIRGGAGARDADQMLEFVGTDAYVAAGGVIEEDLFGGGHRIVHIGTLTELYYPKLEAAQAALKETLRDDVEIVTSSANVGQYVWPDSVLSDEQRDRLTVIDARCDEIHEEIEQLADLAQVADDESVSDTKLVADRPDDQAKVDALSAELSALETESEAIHTDTVDVLPDGPLIAVAQPKGGQLVVINWHRPKGWIDPARATGGSGAAGDPPAASLDKPIGLEPSAGYGGPNAAAKATKEEHGLTADTIEVMRSHRRSILRAMMVGGTSANGQGYVGYAPPAAADLLPFTVLRKLCGAGRYGQPGANSPAELGVAQGAFATAAPPVVAKLIEEVAEQPGTKAWKAAIAAIDAAEWMTEPDLRRAFALFTAAPERERDLASAVAAGLMLDRSLDAPGYRVPLHDELALLMGQSAREEVRQHWSPDEAFFARLPKSRRLAAVEAIAPGVAKEIGKLPTADIAAACALFFTGSDEARKRWRLQPNMIANAKRWVPDFLAFEPDQGKARIVDVMAAERAEVTA